VFLRFVAAAAAAVAVVFAILLAWLLWPLQSGLAFGHAIVATILAVAAVIRAVRLERMHLDDPHPSDVAGPAWATAAVFLLADAATGYVRATLQLDALGLLLMAAALVALLLHVLAGTLAPGGAASRA
jgi:hypothetical protein